MHNHDNQGRKGRVINIQRGLLARQPTYASVAVRFFFAHLGMRATTERAIFVHY